MRALAAELDGLEASAKLLKFWAGSQTAVMSEDAPTCPTCGRPMRLIVTPREAEVLMWAARGKTAGQIGKILGITQRTVNEHVQSATAKLGATNKTQAVAHALLRRIIEV